MPPGGGGKRKRGDRTWSGDSTDRQRPSPHRPENLNLAQQSQGQHQGYGREQDGNRGRGGRRPSRGGRGGPSLRSPTNLPRQGQNQLRSPTMLQPMSPPVTQGRRDQPDVSQSITQQLSIPPTFTVPEQTPPPKRKPQPCYFEHMSDTTIQEWESSGRPAMVEVGVQARDKEDYMTLSSLYQEIVRSGLDGRISLEEAGLLVKDIVGDETPADTPMDIEKTMFKTPPFDARVVFLDTLSILTDSDHDNPDIHPIVLSTSISANLMRQILETPLLQSLGLIRDTFARMGIRKQTNLLYRQSNYNLLREESEGYSKLLTELFTTSTNGLVNNDVVEDTFERVKAMVGAFDMDVGRVLDVTLDVFAAVVVRQNRFFVKLLRTSSWWPKDDDRGKAALHELQTGLPKWALPGGTLKPLTDEEKAENDELNEKRDHSFWERVREVGIKAFFELGRRRATEHDLKQATSSANDPESAELGEDQRWIQETGTLPPRGNRVAAQLLGFKLRFYASSSRDPSDNLPENLIFLTALLIKIGFISLRDLYPHLWPLDEAMAALKEKKMGDKAQAERDRRPGTGGKNALAMAGALEDDTAPPPPSSRLREGDPRPGTPVRIDEPEKTNPEKTEEKDLLPEPTEQKVQLLKSLLAIGALPESLYILGRFPWLLDVYPELPACICRILHQSLNRVYALVEPPPFFEANLQAPSPDADQSGLPKGHVRLGEHPPRKVFKWAELDQQDARADGNSYRFYWDEWADNIPSCRSVDDVFLLCGSLLNLLGVKIGMDSALVTKLARIGKASMHDDSSESNRSRWLDLCKRLLVPALSLTSREPGVVNEVWEILSMYPRNVRYNVYAEWYQGSTSRLPDIKSALDFAKAETKDVLKRISKNNTRYMARILAKVAYSSPGIVLTAALSQIEAYDNLIQLVIACARYFSELGYDVMTWSLLTALGQEGRNRVQSDGLFTSKWLGSLALFTGRVFKQYERTDCSPVLQYVAEQLRQKNATDLIVLEQLTTNLGGINSDATFNDAQIQAMGGGRLLQSQTLLQLLDKRVDNTNTSDRLMQALTDTNLVGELLISIAQVRKTCVFDIPDEDAHPKLLGIVFDEIHRVLTQYLDLLRYKLSVQDFDELVPDVSSLIADFKIEPEVAFWISRESIAWAMAEADKTAQQQNERRKSQSTAVQTSKDVNGGVDMVDEHPLAPEVVKEEARTSTKSEMEIDDTANGQQKHVESPEAAGNDTPAPSPPSVEVNGDSTPWHGVLQERMEKLRRELPEDLLQSLDSVGLPFYMTFWQMSLFDVHIPAKAYEDQIERHKREAARIGNDRSDPSASGVKKKDAAKKAEVKKQDQLLAENKSHLKSYSQTRMRLQKEKEHWFTGMQGKYEALSIALLEQCFMPRIFLSAVDSFYCFKMFKFLHSSGTPNFKSIMFLDQFFKEQRLTSLFFLCTSREAEHLGRFLCDLLKDLGRWHADKSLYEKEAFGPKKDLPGFARGIDAEGKPDKFLDYEDFRRLLYKWHRLLGNTLKTCFTGGEYMHIWNSIAILKAVSQVFPAVNWMGRDQVALVTKLSESESREDLKLAATSLLGSLKKREKQWKLPQAFQISEPTLNSMNGVKSTPSTPIPSKAQPVPQKSLNAEATDFKPSAAANTNKPQASGKLEVEDGEIEDAKMTDVGPSAAADVAQPTSDDREVSQEKPQAPDIVSPETEPRQASAPPAPSSKPSQADLQSSRPNPTPVGAASHSKDAEPSNIAPAPPREVIPSGDPPRADIPRRPEIDRGVVTSSSGFRSQHNLPSRPEPRNFRPSDARIPPRPPLASAVDERRDPRPQDYGRSGRLADQDRDRDRLPSREDPHGSRDHGRIHERGILDRDREHHDPHRSADREFFSRVPDDRVRPSSREPRGSTREAEWQDRSTRPKTQDPFPPKGDQDHPSRDPSRDNPIAPPRSNMAAHPDRAALIHQHPERGPIINGDRDRRSGASRIEGDERRNRSSRPTSPKRHDERVLRSERHGEHALAEGRRGPPEPFNVNQSAPPINDDRPSSGPRDRNNHSAPFEQDAANEPQRDSRPGLLPPLRFESSHGRLNQDARSRQENTSQDRMNAPPDIPSGPRGRMVSGRGGRGGGAIQPHINTQVSSQPSQASERQPPTGPSSSSGRPNMRHSNHQDHASTPSASAPSTPAVQQSETVGVHPDRLKHIQSPIEELRPGQAKATGARPNSTHAPSPTSALPPSGPRSSQIAPAVNQPPRGPSSGPSFSVGERGRGDKRFASLQQTLAGGQERGGMGASIRGRGAKQGGLPNQSPQHSAPPTPGPEQYPPAPNGRPDLFSGRNNEPAQQGPSQYQAQQRQEEDQRGPLGRRRPEPEAAGETRRSTRHSSSRTHSVERDRNRDRRGGHESDMRLPSGGGGKRDDIRDNRDHEYPRDRHPESNTIAPRDAELHEGREGPEIRESSSRRPREEAEMINPPPKRQRRGDREDFEGGHERRLPPPPYPPPHQPQMSAPMEDERRWGGRDHMENRDRDPHRDNRDRERDHDRDRRDGASGGEHGNGNGRLRKRGMPFGGVEGEADRDGSSGRGSGPGPRLENKRPRRGPP